MRILLVNPPRSPANAIYDHAPPEAKHLVHRKLIGPPLGLLVLAAAAREHEVTLLELKAVCDLQPAAPQPEVLLAAAMERVRPRLVGVTLIASEVPAGLALLRRAKLLDPQVLTVAGGLHAVLCPEQLDDPAVDIVYRAPGPRAFAELAAALEQGRTLDSIGGLLLRDGPGQPLRPSRAPLPACDPAGADLVLPDRSLVAPLREAYRVGQAPGPSTYLFTSLGCPHRCTFCSIWPQHGGAFFQRSASSVVEELGTLDDYPVVRFCDANTLVDLSFAEELLDLIAAEGIAKQYIMDIRVDTAASNPRLMERLAGAGLKVAICGFESFRAAELESYSKGIAPDLIAEAVRVLNGCGVLVRGNYVIPPGYGEQDFAALAEFASRHAVALAGYTILTPMPGTALYRQVRPRITDHDLSLYNFFNCVLRTRLPLARFYEQLGALWRIRLGDTVI